jgi:RING-like zinc finger
MTAPSARSHDPPARRRRPGLLTFLCCGTLLIHGYMMRGVEATITVVSTGTRYGCRQDKAVGKQLWRGYEYMAALQFVPGNLPLCPPPISTSSSAFEESDSSLHVDINKAPATPYANITVPDDGLPVALLVRSGTGCTLHDKIEFALTRIQPAGVVRYLIVDDADADSVVISDEPTGDTKTGELEAASLTARLEEPPSAPELFRPSRVEIVSVLDDGGNDVPLYILYVSPKTQFELLDYLLKLDPAVVASGGPRISLDSRATDGWWDGEGAIWIALSALLSACACSFLLIAGGTAHGWWQPEEDHHPAPARPQRRRLTREQVKRMLPYWRFDGTSLQATSSEGGGGGMRTPLLARAADGQGEETVGLVAASAEASRDPPAADSVIPPQPLELSLCSICLDDYEAGDRLRVLHCNHAFHGKVSVRWLVGVVNRKYAPHPIFTSSASASGSWSGRRPALCASRSCGTATTKRTTTTTRRRARATVVMLRRQGRLCLPLAITARTAGIGRGIGSSPTTRTSTFSSSSSSSSSSSKKEKNNNSSSICKQR